MNEPMNMFVTLPHSYQCALWCFLFSSERTKTQCETHRDSLLGAGPRGPRPPIGQYVPTCDENGAYEPMQCHSSTGHCWCVDRNGQEIPGTRSGPGSRPMCEYITCVYHRTTKDHTLLYYVLKDQMEDLEKFLLNRKQSHCYNDL